MMPCHDIIELSLLPASQEPHRSATTRRKAGPRSVPNPVGFHSIFPVSQERRSQTQASLMPPFFIYLHPACCSCSFHAFRVQWMPVLNCCRDGIPCPVCGLLKGGLIFVPPFFISNKDNDDRDTALQLGFLDPPGDRRRRHCVPAIGTQCQRHIDVVWLKDDAVDWPCRQCSPEGIMPF
uniref:Uncharacterized protein n=1 Tax=Panagrellus redivivus TaxID=6233 RepID=A0A7E4WBB4_PANRE